MSCTKWVRFYFTLIVFVSLSENYTICGHQKFHVTDLVVRSWWTLEQSLSLRIQGAVWRPRVCTVGPSTETMNKILVIQCVILFQHVWWTTQVNYPYMLRSVKKVVFTMSIYELKIICNKLSQIENKFIKNEKFYP